MLTDPLVPIGRPQPDPPVGSSNIPRSIHPWNKFFTRSNGTTPSSGRFPHGTPPTAKTSLSIAASTKIMAITPTTASASKTK
ncbi:hypothetical protein LOK49_LG05G03075 [Camellia lanceoleosa]|uniref:Uncharacterized protein n=1 Tax=Camellia lanceoleosa TaxID=1840588 RepID=A0ACC0HJM3_9ERIC|nr:hypothetical protein LOK49_LG05G03075 [Camellia lanceoleosa]